jgi:hypothetical protein
MSLSQQQQLALIRAQREDLAKYQRIVREQVNQQQRSLARQESAILANTNTSARQSATAGARR